MMNHFKIMLDPPIPRAPGVYPKISLDMIDLDKTIQAVSQEYNIYYLAAGRYFTYYPASILTIINDIDLEFTLIQKRKSHLMSLSGYTILEMVFTGERVYLFEPFDVLGSEKKPIGAAFEASYIEQAFKVTLDSLWHLIKAVDGLR